MCQRFSCTGYQLYPCKVDQQNDSSSKVICKFAGDKLILLGQQTTMHESAETHHACVSADSEHTIQHGMSARNEQHSTASPACLIPGYMCCQQYSCSIFTLRVLSVFRSRDILESGKKKCNRPKLSRSFRQTSLANAFMAPGYCTGSRSTTCKQIEPVMMCTCCFAVVLW